MAENESSPEDAEYQHAQQKRHEEAQKQQQQDAQIRAMLKQLLEPAAYERLQNVRLSNPELYQKVAQLIVMLYQQGKLQNKLDESTLKALLGKLLGSRRESKISFTRK